MHWVKLPSGKRINLALIIDVAESPLPSGKARIFLHAAIPLYQHNADATGSADPYRLSLSGEDRAALLDWLDGQGPDLGNADRRHPR